MTKHDETLSSASSDDSPVEQSVPIVVPPMQEPPKESSAPEGSDDQLVASASAAAKANLMRSPLNGKSLGVMNPNGKMVWVPYQEDWTTLDMLKSDVAAAWGTPQNTDFQITRAMPLLSDALIDYQCMAGEILYVLPKPVSSMTAAAAPAAAGSAAAAPTSRRAVPTPATPDTSFSSDMTASTAASMSVGWYQLPPDERIAHAARNLEQIVNNAKSCTELQANLEQAHSMRVDCTPVLQKVELNLQDLVVHPAGNYLVSKCFDYHVPLIQQATDLLGRNLRMYALHKHASYVIETILTHQMTPLECRRFLITEIFNPTNRITIATHDSGNFVIQRAIECCPDDLVETMTDAVVAVAPLTPHGAKMQKKVLSRVSKGSAGNFGPRAGEKFSENSRQRGEGVRRASGSNNQQQQQQPRGPPQAPPAYSSVAHKKQGGAPAQQQQQQATTNTSVPASPSTPMSLHHLPPSQHMPPTAPAEYCDQAYDQQQQQQIPQQQIPQQQMQQQQQYHQYPAQGYYDYQGQQQQQPQQQQIPQQQHSQYALPPQEPQQDGKHSPYATNLQPSPYHSASSFPSTPPSMDEGAEHERYYAWQDVQPEIQH